MRTTKRNSGFLVCFLINAILNIDGLIPAGILLVLHFVFDISILWSILAAIVWLGVLIVKMLLLRWVNSCSNTPEKEKVNKNPYSVGAKKE